MKPNRPTICSRHRSLWLAMAAVLLPLGTPFVRTATAFSAPSEYWDPGHSGTVPGSGGNGTWDLMTTNWIQNQNGTDSAYVGGSANFEGAAGTVSLNSSGVSAVSALFYTAGYVLQDAPGTSYALTLSAIDNDIASGTTTVSLPVNMTGNLSGLFLGTGSTLSLTGTLTANNGLNAVGGTVILSGNNAITGMSYVSGGGTLQLAATGTNQPLGGTSGVQVSNGSTLLYAAGSSNQVPTGLPVSLGGSTFNVNGQSQDRAHTLGALTVSGNSELDFSSRLSLSSVLAFGKSSAAAWSGTLSVYNYRGTPGVGGGTDQLFFGTDATGLTSTQLGDISFYSGGAGSTLLGTGVILADGEVTYAPGAVPEPSTWAAVLAGTGLLGLVLRRRRPQHR